MSAAQRIFERILPATWFARIRESSEHWMIQCTKCKSEKSVWSVGGIRFGAATIGKRVAANCSTCGHVVAARVHYQKDGHVENNSRMTVLTTDKHQ